MNLSEPQTAVLGIDLGTQSTKVALVSLDGRPLGSHAVSVSFERPQPGWAEQSPEVLVQSSASAIRALMAEHPGTKVVGVGVAAQMGGAIGIDEDFAATTPHEMWLDTRADADRAELLAQFGQEILSANGIIPFVTPRLRHWQREDPARVERTVKVVAPAGYLVGRLTGARASDAVCDRTQANLFGCFNVSANAWDLDLAGRSGLPPKMLPRIADPFEIVGRVTEPMAIAYGLAPGTPVTAGMGDGTGGWLAAGGIDPGICVDTSGSSAHFAVTIDHFATDPGGLLSCMPSAVPGRFYLLGFTTSTGLAHRWLRDMSQKSYADLGALAEASPIGANGLLAVPHFNGRVSPFEPSIKGAFIGIDDKTGPGDLYRALLEASAYELDIWLAAARRLAPEVTLSTVVNVGGGAQSTLWNQIKADVTGLAFRSAPVEVNAARGAALAAGIAVGAVNLARRDWFAPTFLGGGAVVPDPEGYKAYRPWCENYHALTEHLLPIYRKLHDLSRNIQNRSHNHD